MEREGRSPGEVRKSAARDRAREPRKEIGRAKDSTGKTKMGTAAKGKNRKAASAEANKKRRSSGLSPVLVTIELARNRSAIWTHGWTRSVRRRTRRPSSCAKSLGRAI